MYDMLLTQFNIGDCVAHISIGQYGKMSVKKGVVSNVTDDEVKVQIISCSTDIHGDILGATISWVKTSNVIKVPTDEKYVQKIIESTLPNIEKVNGLIKSEVAMAKNNPNPTQDNIIGLELTSKVGCADISH